MNHLLIHKYFWYWTDKSVPDSCVWFWCCDGCSHRILPGAWSVALCVTFWCCVVVPLWYLMRFPRFWFVAPVLFFVRGFMSFEQRYTTVAFIENVVLYLKIILFVSLLFFIFILISNNIPALLCVYILLSAVRQTRGTAARKTQWYYRPLRTCELT